MNESVAQEEFSPCVEIEFAVELECQSCEQAVRNVLRTTKDVDILDVSVSNQAVVLRTSQPSNYIKEVIESTGRRAIIKGVATASKPDVKLVGPKAAVSIISNHSSSAITESKEEVQGVIRIVNKDDSSCSIDGTLDGLVSNTLYSIFIHQFGDVSDGCASCGEIYNTSISAASIDSPNNSSHKPTDDGAVGEIGAFISSDNGRIEFSISRHVISLADIIGRSIVVHSCAEAQQDKSGSSTPVACGIIARSAGVFDNRKVICTCDGVTQWDELNIRGANK